MGYEVVIGLEVHTHLRTQSKLFSPAPVAYGDDPNHDTHPIDLALPGVLPVLNRAVIELAIRLGLATNSTINHRSVFSRKNYFYPDLPKGYQISQYEEPTVSDGWLEIDVPIEGAGGKNRKKKQTEAVKKRIGITRAHLEEDAGKSIHDPNHAGSDTLVDLNRAGVPLLEIVSEPDLRSASQASAYLRKLRAILRYIGVSDADMEKGQFRCDANVSLRRPGAELGTRTETKNLNSFAFVEAAIHAEIERQAEVLDDGGEVVQATMSFDPATGRTSVMRLKENADDYRYFDDPDLIPLQISDEDIEAVRGRLPELPDQKRDRFERDLDLGSSDATTLTQSLALAEFFEATIAIYDAPKTIANWILRDVLQTLGESDAGIEALGLVPENFAALVKLVDSGRLTVKNGREIFALLAESGGDPEAIMLERGLESVQDSGLIEGVAKEVIANNPDSVAKYREGDAKVLNFLMGQVMKATQGKASPADVKQILERELEDS
ncbi:MAG: Asp-tRNA(Asn)/Glu-tRNA(Gln) amidotransferase subunit GatB [bacterium]|nr:Asp-tRNA(Asn)/Glu-tRNA(Gln) amidotransferase subunit GatB [bacterium]